MDELILQSVEEKLRMNHFADRLTDAVRTYKNPTVMGLDPIVTYIPDSLNENAAYLTDDPEQATGLAIIQFNDRLIDATADIIPVVKLQSACYEQYGLSGLSAMRLTIDYAHEKGLLVILDGKRNDIGSTAQAYANAYLDQSRLIDGTVMSAFNADALTVNGYLGLDGIQPFIDSCEKQGKGIFILVRTSNPSAGDLQDLVLEDGRTVAEAMADRVHFWGQNLIGQSGYSSVGAVVGATWPSEAESLRIRMPNALFLIPGYGAQGGSAKDAVSGFGRDGLGGLVNASRSLMTAWKKHNMEPDLFDQAARIEALAMRDALQQALRQR